MSDSLTALRARIAAIDTQILALAAERFAVVCQVGESKRAEGLPVRSFAAEADVIGRFRTMAAERGLPEGFAERLALQLIGGSVQLQEEELSATLRPVAARRVTIVGGAGKMGRWLAGFFTGQGHDVSIYDVSGPVEGVRSVARLSDAVRDAEVVLLATPLGSGREVLEETLTLDPPGLVADIFSLKSQILDVLRGAVERGLRVTSIHPLFGPNVRTLAGRVLAVCDCGNREAAVEMAAYFDETALTVTRVPVERHDEYMQYVLGLSHLVSILFFTTLAGSGFSFESLESMASTTFHKQTRAAASVAGENPDLYYEIQKRNRHSAEIFDRIRQSFERIEAAVREDGPESFARIMQAGRDYFPSVLPRELD